MDRADVYGRVASLHAECIDRGFLPTLGGRFLTGLYRAIDAGSESILLVEVRDGGVVGFVAGTRGMRSIYLRMLKHPCALLAALGPSLIRPDSIRKIFDLMRYDGRGETALELPDAELLSIAVHPAYRGSGIADALYRRLSDRFREQGVPCFKITVGSSLESAHRFYHRMGAQAVCEIEVHPGETSTVYLQATSSIRLASAGC